MRLWRGKGTILNLIEVCEMKSTIKNDIFGCKFLILYSLFTRSVFSVNFLKDINDFVRILIKVLDEVYVYVDQFLYNHQSMKQIRCVEGSFMYFNILGDISRLHSVLLN